MYSYYNQDDSISLNYIIDNNQIRIDEHGPMFMESSMLSDSVCPTNSIGCTNISNAYSSTQQMGVPGVYIMRRRFTNAPHVISVLHGIVP